MPSRELDPLRRSWQDALYAQPDGKIHVLHYQCCVCNWVWFVRQEDPEIVKCLQCLKEFKITRREFVTNATLLQGTMEGSYTVREGKSTLEVAERWDPWWNPNHAMPEYQAETRQTGHGRVHNGERAQKWFNFCKPMNGGIWQRVATEPGRWYRFAGFIYPWVGDGDNVDESDGEIHAMVGVNQWGHWPQQYATIYGKEVLMAGHKRYNRWQEVEILFQAWGNETSLIVCGLTSWGFKHNDMYVDDFTFDEIEVHFGPSPEPPPLPPPPTGEFDYDRITREVVAGVHGDIIQIRRDEIAALGLHYVPSTDT